MFAVAVVMVPLAVLVSAGGAHAATAPVCTGQVAVTEFAFSPSSVPLGSTSALTMVLQNCTSQAVQGTTVWNGTYTGQGCPALDGPPQSYTIAAGATTTLTVTYGDGGFAGCTPTALRINANVSVNGTGTVTGATATLQFTAACNDGIAIRQFAFSPTTVAAGQDAMLTLVLQNCGTTAVTGSTVWASRFTYSTGTGIPPGCPVMDPLSLNYSIAAGATATQTSQLGDSFATCLATGITATVTVNVGNVGAAATASANLVITQPVTIPSPSCSVTYSPNNWQGGFTANVTITNNGPSALNGWTLDFAFPGDQHITGSWNAGITQAGADVTATNTSSNGAIPVGGSQSFGFQGTWSSNDTAPSSFTLNGTICT